MNLSLKKAFLLMTVFITLLPFSSPAGEVSDRHMIWAHNTP